MFIPLIHTQVFGTFGEICLHSPLFSHMNGGGSEDGLVKHINKQARLLDTRGLWELIGKKQKILFRKRCLQITVWR